MPMCVEFLGIKMYLGYQCMYVSVLMYVPLYISGHLLCVTVYQCIFVCYLCGCAECENMCLCVYLCEFTICPSVCLCVYICECLGV